MKSITIALLFITQWTGKYFLMNRVYRSLQGPRPEFEGIHRLYNRENSLSFDDFMSQLLHEGSQLQEIKGRTNISAYITAHQGVTSSSNQPNQSSGTPITNHIRKSHPKGEDQLL